MLPFMNTDEAISERRSDIDALANWAQHSASADAEGPGGGGLTSTASGVVERVDSEHLWLQAHSDASEAAHASIYHHLPKSLDLRPLVGLALRATMMCVRGSGQHLERTLLLTAESGRVWLIARSGTIHGETHTLSRSDRSGSGDILLHAALSQRPLGPLVIGTAELQCLVPVGQSALLRLRDGSRFRALLIKRRDDGTASYVIADASLFAEKPS